MYSLQKEKSSTSVYIYDGKMSEDQPAPPPAQFQDETDAGLVLRESNDKLVSYIDKARLMAGVKEMRGALPDTLKQTSFIEVECKKSIQAESEVLQAKIREAREKKKDRMQVLEKAMKENHDLEKKSSSLTQTYWAREREHEGQDKTEAELVGKLQSGKLRCSQLTEQVTVSDAEIAKKRRKISREVVEEPAVTYRANVEKIDVIRLNSIHEANYMKRQQELEEVSLKIKMEYEKQMKDNMKEQRAIYVERYRKMIASIEADGRDLLATYMAAGEMLEAQAVQEETEQREMRLRSHLERRDRLREDIKQLVVQVRSRERDVAGLGGEGAQESRGWDERTEEQRKRMAGLLGKITEMAR
jgi:hypothetical protein